MSSGKCVKAHTNQAINQVWGGAKSGIDGGNDKGKSFTDTPGGLKLQCEGHDVRFRNIWLKELDLNTPASFSQPSVTLMVPPPTRKCSPRWRR